MTIRIVGGGLAGSEAAWQAASRGVPVTLYEMRPVRATAVHKTDRLAELVCSNSFRGDKLDNAVGLLKEEMRRLGSLVMRAAEASRVPAGAALAVDRERFAETVTQTLSTHPLITVVREEVGSIPASSQTEPVIVATGPLTSEALSADLASMVGQAHLYFYDAISPIVLADTIDRSKVFRQSRWDRSLRGSSFDRLRTSEATSDTARGEPVEPRAKRLILRRAQDERVQRTHQTSPALRRRTNRAINAIGPRDTRAVPRCGPPRRRAILPGRVARNRPRHAGRDSRRHREPRQPG
jgi:hypothetical protein